MPPVYEYSWARPLAAEWSLPSADRGQAGAVASFPVELDALELAPRLIGARLLIDGVGGTIVETEAYLRNDPASHSFRGLSRANAAMFGPPWHAYIYRSYGLHWCFNIVASRDSGVLIRALAPEHGIEQMSQRRGAAAARLCAGPGCLTQALGVTGALNGLSLSEPPFDITFQSDQRQIVSGPRIGISKARNQPWRFGLAGSPYLSKPFEGKAPETAGQLSSNHSRPLKSSS